MPFWSTERIKKQQEKVPLIDPATFSETSIKQGSYELKLGDQAAVTQDGQSVRIKLDSKEFFNLPPGQFGIMLTEEVVTIPPNVLGLISFKTKIKASGLVNVSGFHVDPGYEGKLKFWVYNAGPQNIPIQRGDPTFLIWFAEFDQETKDTYPAEKRGGAHNEITATDLQLLQGHLASPAALARQIKDLEHKIQFQEYITTTLTLIVTGLGFALAAPLFEHLLKFLTE